MYGVVDLQLLKHTFYGVREIHHIFHYGMFVTVEKGREETGVTVEKL